MSGSGPSRAPPAGIPTLTEVVPWPGRVPAVPAVTAAPVAPTVALPPSALPAAPPVPPGAAAAAPARAAAPAAAPVVAAAPINEAQLTQKVLADLQRQIDLMLEVRLREVLAPVLSRAADALIRDARKELTAALRDAVARSIAQELASRRDR